MKIYSIAEIRKIAKLHKLGQKTTVLVGGCFDILHIGHVKFLKEAKKKANVLVVLLESDEKVKKLKGQNRPFFNQDERAQVLASLNLVDLVILLPSRLVDKNYEQIVKILKPNILACTRNDPLLLKKKAQIKSVGGKLELVPLYKTYSTSILAKVLGID